jgi:DNA modification methylase
MITDIGIHRVQHGDIMNGLDELMEGDKADFIYTDPPWGQGNLTYWQTMNKKMTGKERNQIDYNKFIDYFFSLMSRYAKDKVVVEYGQQWHDDIVILSKRHGFIHNGSCKSLYRSGSKLLPLDMHFLSKLQPYEVTSEIQKDCMDLKGFTLVDKIFDHLCPKNAGIVLDAMCGMGYTAQATVNRGIAFRGNELNAKRLEKTIARL